MKQQIDTSTLEIFTLTEEHIKLLENMCVSWQDYDEYSLGAPEINPKRPYGNSDTYTDIYEILDKDTESRSEYQCPDEYKERYKKLHTELKDVLQICLSTKSFITGVYQKEKYTCNWEMAKYDTKVTAGEMVICACYTCKRLVLENELFIIVRCSGGRPQKKHKACPTVETRSVQIEGLERIVEEYKI